MMKKFYRMVSLLLALSLTNWQNKLVCLLLVRVNISLIKVEHHRLPLLGNKVGATLEEQKVDSFVRSSVTEKKCFITLVTLMLHCQLIPFCRVIYFHSKIFLTKKLVCLSKPMKSNLY